MDCTTKGIRSCVICPLDEEISGLKATAPLDGKDFLAFDNRNIIGFATENNLRLLCESTNVQGDGTFKTVPKLFHQLYTLHVSVGSGSTTETAPVVYAHNDINRDLFLNIHSKYEDLGLVFNPSKLILDDEAAPIGVANELYPICQICGCNFHFSQCNMLTVHLIYISSFLPLPGKIPADAPGEYSKIPVTTGYVECSRRRRETYEQSGGGA